MWDVFILGIIIIACLQALVFHSPRTSLEASAASVTVCSERVSGCVASIDHWSFECRIALPGDTPHFMSLLSIYGLLG